MRFLTNTRIKKIFILFLAIIVIAEIIILQKSTFRKSLDEYAQDILLECSKLPSLEAQVCYEKEIPKLMDVITMEDAFLVTKRVQAGDTNYRYCHVLGHKLSAREIQKDESKWKEVVTRCPSGVCSNGCIHGGFQEKFRAESLTDSQIEKLKPDLKNLCEKRDKWNPTQLEQASCYHALGHLTMYLTKADIKKSITLCKELTIKEDGRDYNNLCLDGAFMQIFQPLEPEDFALIRGKEVKAPQVASFCKQFEGLALWSCRTESWPLFFSEVTTPEGLDRFCSNSDTAEEEKRCYVSLVYVLNTQFELDTNKMHTFCIGLPEGNSQSVDGMDTINKRGMCFANTASRLIETDYNNIDKAVRFCSIAKPFDTEGQCFNELLKFSTYNFHAKSPEFYHLCNAMPGAWKDKCLAQAK